MSHKCQIQKICKYCGKIFSVNCARVNSAFYCSRSCSARGTLNTKGKHWTLSSETKSRMRGKHSKEKNGRWKGGRRYTRGHIYILMPNHPFATKQGYVFEHRLVMEKVLGRYLRPQEIVHHKNKIHDDNRPENLELTNRRHHPKFHPELADHIKGVNRWK